MPPSSNLRLFTYGILLALISVLYPRLPSYLPQPLGDLLPFLSTPLPPSSQSWSRWQKYQHGVPIASDFDPFDLDGPKEERELRMGSKDGMDQMRKEEKRLRRELERRVELAGDENRVHKELPVYFVEQAPTNSAVDPNSALYKSISIVGNEIVNVLQAKTIILFTPLSGTSASHLLVSTASHILSSSPSNPQTYTGNPSLAHSLLNTFAHSNPGIPAVASSRTLDAPAWPILDALFDSIGQDAKVSVVVVGLPVGAKGWDSEKWFDVGHALLKMRKEEDDVVILGIGSTRPKNPAPYFLSFLSDSLTHHTSHPRALSLSSLFSGTSGNKPVKTVSKELVGLYAVVGAAGEGEGEMLDDEGRCWRFGGLPVV